MGWQVSGSVKHTLNYGKLAGRQTVLQVGWSVYLHVYGKINGRWAGWQADGSVGHWVSLPTYTHVYGKIILHLLTCLPTVHILQ